MAEWATGAVLRVPLPDGAATANATAEPFLTGLKPPVPVSIAPSRAVVVGDRGTGTVYLIRASASASFS